MEFMFGLTISLPHFSWNHSKYFRAGNARAGPLCGHASDTGRIAPFLAGIVKQGCGSLRYAPAYFSQMMLWKLLAGASQSWLEFFASP